jgi:iron(III) transport system substrate-binding protein
VKIRNLVGTGAAAALAAMVMTVCMSTPGSAAPQSAGGKAWAKVVAKANQEGAVTFYTSFPTGTVQQAEDGFQKAYPNIKLTVVRDTSPNLQVKISAEQSTNSAGADVYVGTDLGYFAQEDAVGELTKATGPNVASFPTAGAPSANSIVVVRLPFVVAYNTTLVSKAPTSWKSLLDPAYGKGKICLLSWTASPVVLATYDYLAKTQGPSFMSKLAAQDPVTYKSTVQQTQELAAGACSVAAITQPAAVSSLTSTGAPLKYVIPTGKTAFGLVNPAAILSNAHHPAAAQVFMNWMLSKAGQTALNTGAGLGQSPLGNIKGALPDVPAVVTYNVANYPANVVQKQGAHYAAIFGMAS